MTFTEFIQAAMTALYPVVIAAIVAIGGIGVALIRRYVAAFEQRNGIMVTAQDEARVLSAVTTGVGLLQTKLDLKLIRPVDILPSNAVVLKEAEQAIAREAERAAPAGGATIPIVAAMIAARVDTTPRPAPPVPLAAGT